MCVCVHVRRARCIHIKKRWTNVRKMAPRLLMRSFQWNLFPSCDYFCLFRSPTSNPGAATPESLHRLYKNQAAATANPYTLHNFASHSLTESEKHGLLGGFDGSNSNFRSTSSSSSSMSRKRGGSPPRASFRCVSKSNMSAPYRVL